MPSKNFKKIIEDNDIVAGFKFLYDRAYSIQQKKIIKMIKEWIVKKGKE